MIGKIIGAAAGAQAAKHSKNLGGVGGAAIGALAVPFISRLRIPVLLALGAGAYGFKKLTDKEAKPARKKTAPRKASKTNAAARPAA